MDILVTGGTVFAGRFTAEYFAAQGHRVYVLNRGTRQQSENVTHIKADRHNLSGILDSFHFDAVLDICAYTRKDVADLLEAAGNKTAYIFVSSSAVYPETLPQPFNESQETGRNAIWGDYGINKAKAMELLGIEKADVFGVSQGGMAAQYMAVYHPQLVNRLVLAVTASRVNPTIKKIVGAWIDMVRDKKYPALISDMFEKMYSENYLKKNKLLMPVLSRTFRLDDPDRFTAPAKACFTCDNL